MSALGPGFTAGLCKLNISKNDWYIFDGLCYFM
jgi:hypothetical protein